MTPVPPVLVLRALGLGDALTAVPALRGLRRRYGDRPLLLAGPGPVSGWLHRMGIVDGVVPFDSLTGPAPGLPLGPHTAVNLHGRGPESHRVLLAGAPDRLIAFDCPEAGHHSESRWRADEHEVRRWCRLINDGGGACSVEDLRLTVTPLAEFHDAVLLHPGAASRARQWPPERWAQVAAALVAGGNQVVLTGGPAERDLCDWVARLAPGCADLSGTMTLDELAGAVAAARLLLSGDTGIAHVGTATGTRSVTLFGPTPPAWWGPAIDQDRHTVRHHGLHGAGVGDPHADEVDPALLAITVDEVLDGAHGQLDAASLTGSAPG